ncbi:MAG TPA: YdcF family protein [Cyanophyceae cyanobacterium]
MSLVILLSSLLLANTLRLQAAASGAVDVFFVLGGSVRREIYVAELAKQHPESRILISHGSPDPCILLIFQRENAPIRQVWLEHCADSTFDNFYFNIPILRLWGVRKVKLITSPTHLPRAKWMAQILLGAHGIWVEPEIIQEKGIPGNKESSLKTSLDITRSLIWAVLSQVVQPKCTQVNSLSSVDLSIWQKTGFKCERQAGIES